MTSYHSTEEHRCPECYTLLPPVMVHGRPAVCVVCGPPRDAA